MISLLFNLGMYVAACVAADFFRRGKIRSVSGSATFQRRRWRGLAAERGLVETGAPGELTGTWRGLTVVLDTHFTPGPQLVLGLRVLGLLDPFRAATALQDQRHFEAWAHRVVDGELQLQVPFQGSTLQPAELEAWLDAVRATAPETQSAYR